MGLEGWKGRRGTSQGAESLQSCLGLSLSELSGVLIRDVVAESR